MRVDGWIEGQVFMSPIALHVPSAKMDVKITIKAGESPRKSYACDFLEMRKGACWTSIRKSSRLHERNE